MKVMNMKATFTFTLIGHYLHVHHPQHHHVSHLVNLHVGHLIGYLVNLDDSWCHLITNCQGLLYIGIINRIELVSSSTRVTLAKFQKGLGGGTDTGTHRPDSRYTWVR